jgi:hypothetical protein
MLHFHPVRLEIYFIITEYQLGSGDRRPFVELLNVRSQLTVHATMETHTLSYFPSPYSRTHITLFNNVTNSPAIRKRLIEASISPETPEGEAKRDEVDFAFLEGRLVCSLPSTLINKPKYQS